MPTGWKQKLNMLEWLEVRLDVVCDKRLVYEYRIESLKCDRDALKQECRITRITASGTQPPTHLSENKMLSYRRETALQGAL